MARSCLSPLSRYFFRMSLEALKYELAGLPTPERSQIMAYLVSLQDRADAGYPATLARKVDEPCGSARWATLEDLDRRLSTKKD